MKNRTIVVSGFALLGLVIAGKPALAMDIIACQQMIPRGETGVLQVDLDCPIAFDPDPETQGVNVGPNATLDLNGHTINGGYHTVRCFTPQPESGACTVRGPGVLSGGYAGITTYLGVTKLVVSDVTIRDQEQLAIVVSNGPKTRVALTNVAINDNGAELDGSTAPVVMNARSLFVQNVTGTGNFSAVLSAARISGSNVTLDGNERGIEAGKVRLSNVSITNSTSVGIYALRRSLLEGSTLANNDTGGEGIDILSNKPPKLVGTTCSRSQVCIAGATGSPAFPHCLTQPENWGVCTNDP